MWDKELEPYAQTTAIALIGLQGAGDPKVIQDGYTVLRRLWPVEDGGMSLGLSLIALRFAPDANDSERSDMEAALSKSFDTTAFLDDTVALGWATLATGDSLDVIRVRR